MSTIRILIVDDHTVVRKGTRSLLEQVDEFCIVGEADNGDDAVQQATAHKPDVILMDLQMPTVDGVTAITRIRSQHPHINILALSGISDEDMVFAAIRAGAAGYLPKQCEPNALIDAIRTVAAGETAISPSVAQRMMTAMQQAAHDESIGADLSNRERQVLQAVASGATHEEIAKHLSVSNATVRSHLRNILNKLDLRNPVEATRYALRTGIATLDD